MNRSCIAVFAAVATVGLATPSVADTSASAGLGPLTLQLIDLDPLDGITPSITFLADPFNFGSAAHASAAERYADNQSNRYGASPWQPVSAAATTPLVSSLAMLAGSGGTPAGASLSASGAVSSFTSADPFETASFAATVTGPTGYDNNFMLSAKTLMVLTAMGSVQGMAAGAHNVYGIGNQFSAGVSIEVSGVGPLGGGSQSTTDGLSIFGFGYPGSGPVFLSDSRNLGVSFTNLSAGDLGGLLRVGASASAYTYANAVPEPGTTAMLLAGLAAMGFMLRRRET